MLQHCTSVGNQKLLRRQVETSRFICLMTFLQWNTRMRVNTPKNKKSIDYLLSNVVDVCNLNIFTAPGSAITTLRCERVHQSLQRGSRGGRWSLSQLDSKNAQPPSQTAAWWEEECQKGNHVTAVSASIVGPFTACKWFQEASPLENEMNWNRTWQICPFGSLISDTVNTLMQHIIHDK